MVTQRCFGPTRSLAAQSAATLKVAASGAAHEHLSPTGGRAKRVARMGRSGGYELGKGGVEKPRRGCEVAGRAQAGGANTTCVQGHCARARGGWGAHLRLDLGLLARRQRQDVVDPVGLDVRGRGECPDPAARYPAGSWAQLAGAPSAALRHFMKTSHPLPQPRASAAAIRRRIWSREHRASCGERMRCPSRPRARLSASSATSRSTALGACALKRRALPRGRACGRAIFSRFFSRGRLPLQVTVS